MQQKFRARMPAAPKKCGTEKKDAEEREKVGPATICIREGSSEGQFPTSRHGREGVESEGKKEKKRGLWQLRNALRSRVSRGALFILQKHG